MRAHTRHRPAGTALAVLTVALASCSSYTPGATTAPTGARGDAVVVLHEDAFRPESLTVTAGRTVEWEWQDYPIAHQVDFDSIHVESPLQASGTFFHTFDRAGTYRYHCTTHLFMTGQIVVVAPRGG